MSTLTTGLAGQQQLRSARRGGPDDSPDQAAWPSAALALRCGNLILVPSASGRRPSSQRALPGCSSSPAPAAEVAAMRTQHHCPAIPGLPLVIHTASYAIGVAADFRVCAARGEAI